jgi:CheY-like chemotaxis protein
MVDREGVLELISGSSKLKTMIDLQKNFKEQHIQLFDLPGTNRRLVVVEADFKDKVQKSFSEIRHEVANPLNLIKIMVHILKEGNITEDKKEDLLDDMSRNIERITKILTSLSDKYLQDFEDKTIIQVDQFIDDTLDMFRFVFKDSNVVLDIRKSREVHSCYLTSVGTSLTQAIFNLIKNAFYILKQSDQELKIVKLGFERVGEQLLIFIEDNGPGFDKRAKESIFYKNISPNEDKGHGVDLQLVREYIQQNGGTILLDESFSEGARFKISLPLQGMDKKSILIIDDIEDILSSVQTALGEQYNIKACSNTKVAYQYLLSNTVDLVICDFKMPEETGLEFYDKVSRSYPQTPFILFTAYADDRVRNYKKDIDQFCLVEKPNLPKLEQQVEKMLKLAS